MKKRLYRDETNKTFAGVCAGIANYFDTDPVFIRILWIIFTLAGGSGLIAYILCAIVMPKDPGIYETNFTDRR